MSRLFAFLRQLLQGGSPAPATSSAGIVRRPLTVISHPDTGLQRYRLLVRLQLRAASGVWVEHSFLVDTEAQHTYVPAYLARNLGIAYQTNRPCTIVTRAGTRSDGAFFSPLVFGFAELPDLEFRTIATFSEFAQPGEIPLLAGSDLLNHFQLFIDGQITRRDSDGYFLLRLRDDHGGTPRT